MESRAGAKKRQETMRQASPKAQAIAERLSQAEESSGQAASQSARNARTTISGTAVVAAIEMLA